MIRWGQIKGVPIFSLRAFTLFLCTSLVLACTPSQKSHQITGETMGTTYSVKIVSQDKVQLDKIKKDIEKLLKEVNRQMSTYISDSEISQVNKATAGEEVVISSWFFEVLSDSLDLSEKTGGIYDPTLGPLVNLWGFGPNSTRKVPEPSRIKEVQAYVGHKNIKLIKSLVRGAETKTKIVKNFDRTYVDLSASAKGFGVDKVSELLTQMSLKNHLVEIGGEMRASGNKGQEQKWKVAIESPTENKRSIEKIIELENLSIATSGSYRNFYESDGRKYSHTIDHQTGRPVQHSLVSVSVLHESCMKADALATALMAMGPEKAWKYALDHKIAAYLIIGQKKGIEVLSKRTPQFRNWSQ